MKDKKSQVTVFIIVGLVLLLLSSVLIYTINTQKEGQEKEDIIEKVPLWADPIKNYVDSCVKEKTKEALIKIGEHGGYIDMTDAELSDREFSINVKNPTESDGVSLSTETEQPIAYWWYMSGLNYCYDCYVNSLTPSLDEIQNQISRYIVRELDICLNDFEEFTQQGYIFDKGEIEAETIINELGVEVFVNYPIEVSKEDSKINIESFRANVNLNLLEMLRTAASITLHEMNNQSLERILNYMISAYSGIDLNKLPPIAAVDHEYYSVVWVKDAVEMKLKDIVSVNTNFIRVNQTANSEYFGDAYKIYLLNALSNQTYLSAEMFYLGWPLYFDITPRSGSVLQANTVRQEVPFGIVPPTQTNYYEFFYDISYPVVVMLTDKRDSVKAEFKDGYRFMFGLEANIRDNINLLRWHLGQGTIGLWDYSNVNITTSSRIRDPIAPSKTLMCDPRQRLSGNIEVTVKDVKTGMPLEGAVVTYGCGRYTACAFDATDSKGMYKGNFPVCKGGYLLIEKEGYIGKAMELSTDIGKGKLITTSLEPKRELKVRAKVFKMELPDQCCNTAEELGEGEQIVLMVNKVRDDEIYDQILTQAFVFDEETKEATINLVPGRYEVRATYIDKNKYTIHAKCKHICETVVGCHTDDTWNYDTNTPETDCGFCIFSCCDGADEWVPEEPIEMNSIGGAVFDEATGYWDITKSQIDSAKNVEFYAIRVPDATCIDYEGIPEPKIGLEEMGRVEEYSKKFRSWIEPVFS